MVKQSVSNNGHFHFPPKWVLLHGLPQYQKFLCKELNSKAHFFESIHETYIIPKRGPTIICKIYNMVPTFILWNGKKNIFLKFWESENAKNNFFELLGPKTDINLIYEIWEHLMFILPITLLTFFWGLCAYSIEYGFHNNSKFLAKQYGFLSTFQDFELHCMTKTSWDIVKHFCFVFFSKNILFFLRDTSKYRGDFELVRFDVQLLVLKKKGQKFLWTQ